MDFITSIDQLSADWLTKALAGSAALRSGKVTELHVEQDFGAAIMDAFDSWNCNDLL